MNENNKNPEVEQAEAQLTRDEQIQHLGELLDKSPSRQRARYNPDYSLTPEYGALVGTDTSKMSAKQAEEHAKQLMHFKKFGTFTDAQRQKEIDNSLAIPLSEAISLRDKYMEEILELEGTLDNWDNSKVQAKADLITEDYKKRSKGSHGVAVAQLKEEYDKEIDSLELEELVKPQNKLKVQRAEKIELYKIYEARIRLYASVNREAIAQRIENARNAEIDENLLALAQYMEG